MKHVLAAASVALTFGLVACGGSATVEGTATPASASSATASATASTTGSASASATASASAQPKASASRVPADRPAREVTSIPEQAPVFNAAEQAYLEHLRTNGLNVDGVQDQLAATGYTVCGEDTVTRDAVAGQLVEQRRTDMEPLALANLITDTAREHLCK